MGPQRDRDEADADAGRHRRLPRPAHDGCHALTKLEAALEVERRGPADLGVARPLGRDILDELAGAALERAGILQQRDGQVEGPQQIDLVETARRRHEPGPHGVEGIRGLEVSGSIDAGAQVQALCSAGPQQLERGLGAQRAVEVEVQLRLGHGQQPIPQHRARLAHHGDASQSIDSVAPPSPPSDRPPRGSSRETGSVCA